MEARPNRGRGGSWRRGGRGGHDSDSSGGEHRGRGRGGHHRGRGKRDHYRGRGRGGSAHSAEFPRRDQDEEDNFQEEGGRTEVFSRRKLESNWDRYEASERQETDDETPAQRGTDFHVLLQSAGDSFTQFRFSEEKDWEMDSSAASQTSVVPLDIPALILSLQQVPLHQRLNLEAELLQVSTPVELPAMTPTPKQEIPKTATFTPPPAALKVVRSDQEGPMPTKPASGSVLLVSSSAVELKVDDDDDDGDEELDLLLGLQKPVSGEQSVCEDSVVPEEACEEVKEVVEEKMKEVKDDDDDDVTLCKCAPVRQEMTEEDLEDWLDSMIS